MKMRFAKHLVSKKKRRYREKGFDLDLSFITDNVIAMGFPSSGTEAWYRNSMKDVKKFLERTAADHYKVYNLCSEKNRVYKEDHFHGRVAKYAFPDHNAPPFRLMEPFCNDVVEYLANDPANIAAIHCKAGKGRTGVMICALLMHTKKFADSQEALDFYGNARTKDGKGVTIPSQTRFVHYYGRFLRNGLPYVETPRALTAVRIVGLPKFKSGSCVPFFHVREGPSTEPGAVVYASKPVTGLKKKKDTELLVELDTPVTITNDVKVEFFHRVSKSKHKLMCYVWFNTYFVEDKMIAEKHTIDKAAGDKKCKHFPKDFRLEFMFEPVEDYSHHGTKEPETAAEEPISSSKSTREDIVSITNL